MGIGTRPVPLRDDLCPIGMTCLRPESEAELQLRVDEPVWKSGHYDRLADKSRHTTMREKGCPDMVSSHHDSIAL